MTSLALNNWALNMNKTKANSQLSYMCFHLCKLYRSNTSTFFLSSSSILFLSSSAFCAMSLASLIDWYNAASSCRLNQTMVSYYICKCYIQEPLYNMVHYTCSMVSDITWFKDGPQNVESKQKCMDYTENNDHFWSFFYIIYIYRSIELPATSRHCHNMTERLLKVTLNQN